MIEKTTGSQSNLIKIFVIMKRNLLIIGAGQYGNVVKEIAKETGNFGKIDFIDDASEKAIGTISEIKSFREEYDCAVVSIGNADARKKTYDFLSESGFDIPRLISKRAFVSETAKIEGGVIIEPFAVVNACSEVNRGTFVCAGAIVNHNAKIGEFCTLQCGSIIPSNSEVPSQTATGYGEVYRR